MTNEMKLLPQETVPTFAQAGNALFTVVSKKTGTRFTFRVRAPKDAQGSTPLFVQVLTGSNNDADYTFLGTIFDGAKFVHGKKSKLTPDAPSAKAFAWFWTAVQAKQLTSMDVYHHGRCCKCGRTLTVPSSVLSGVGPECAKGM